MKKSAPVLAGLSELAHAAQVSKQRMSNWYARYPDFPQPLARLSMGSVWDQNVVLQWVRSKHVMAQDAALQRIKRLEGQIRRIKRRALR